MPSARPRVRKLLEMVFLERLRRFAHFHIVWKQVVETKLQVAAVKSNRRSGAASDVVKYLMW